MSATDLGFLKGMGEKLGYYVYALREPGGGIFYVGKGKGNRVYQHAVEARAVGNKKPEALKLNTIKRIHKRGQAVGIDIVRHGLTSEEAYVVEAAVMDMLRLTGHHLTNTATGKKSRSQGYMPLHAPKAVQQNHVHALPSRVELEIRYPRVEGYQQRIRNRVSVDWDSIAAVKVDPMKIPDEVVIKSTLLTQGRPSLLEPGGSAKLDLEAWRTEATMQQREFEMAAGLTKHYSEQDACEAPPHVLFPQMLEIVKRFAGEKVVVDDEAKRIHVFLNPYWGYAIERLTEAIHPSVMDGEDVELPRYEQRRGVGSTAEVDFWTAKKVKEVERSHLNYVVQDSKWEASAAYHLDGSLHVVSFVKNQGLGFAIPYLHAGGDHEYIPDFLVRLTNGVTLILEAKGHDDLAEVKEQAARRWVAAVNADGAYGEWRYALTRNMNEIPVLLADIAGLAAGVA